MAGGFQLSIPAFAFLARRRNEPSDNHRLSLPPPPPPPPVHFLSAALVNASLLTRQQQFPGVNSNNVALPVAPLVSGTRGTHPRAAPTFVILIEPLGSPDDPPDRQQEPRALPRLEEAAGGSAIQLHLQDVTTANHPSTHRSSPRLLCAPSDLHQSAATRLRFGSPLRVRHRACLHFLAAPWDSISIYSSFPKGPNTLTRPAAPTNCVLASGGFRGAERLG
ncbi:hypothetical protein O3P69_006318 [Scylla paramamosain]|uniref:Uncharacterized protein n=1 Tax=Scylla paramamosain TaxID=85552 RepID=A0AAW0U526_SCYPA